MLPLLDRNGRELAHASLLCRFVLREADEHEQEKLMARIDQLQDLTRAKVHSPPSRETKTCEVLHCSWMIAR